MVFRQSLISKYSELVREKISREEPIRITNKIVMPTGTFMISNLFLPLNGKPPVCIQAGQKDIFYVQVSQFGQFFFQPCFV